VIYNIPYRTGVNLSNDTLLELAEQPNIIGVKDSSGNLAQSIELLRTRPAGFFSDDWRRQLLLHNAGTAHGGDGGILASAHLETGAFKSVYERMLANDHIDARRIGRRLKPLCRCCSAKPTQCRLNIASGVRGYCIRPNADSR
jgi:4-hydroxy-tetrahydrodipicolinate synthase